MSEDGRHMNRRILPAIVKMDIKAIALGTLLILLLETYYIITTPGTTLYVFIVDIFLSIAVLLIVASFYITERKKAEEALREMNAQLQTLIQAIPDVIYFKNVQGRNLVVNRAFKKLVGLSQAEIVGKTDEQLLPPDLAEYCRKSDEEVMRSGKPLRVEEQTTGGDGEKLFFDTIKAPLYDDQGNAVGIVGVSRDITERKQAEEALKSAEREKRTILNSLVEHVIHEDTTMKISWANQAACESAGLPREKLIGRHCYEIWPKRSTPCPDCPVVKAMETGQPQKVEKTTPDGRSWFIRGYPVLDVDGDVTGAVEVTLEITERKKAEDALKGSEQKLRDIIDTSPDAIVWVDTTGKITLVNRKGSELTGFSKKDLIGKNFMDVEALTQESKEKILERFMKRLEGIGTSPYEVKIVTKNGEIIPAELSASPIYEGDKIVGTQSIFRDLKERKKAEEALRESEAKFRNLAEQSPNMIFINKNGRVVYANKKCEEIIGYKREEFYSPDFNFLTLIAPENVDSVKSNFSKHMKGEEVAPYEYRLVTKEGKKIEAIITPKLIKYAGESAILGIVTDITKRKQMEEKLRQYSEHLEELVRERTEELTESERRYSVLVEEASDGVVIIQDGKAVFSNNKAAEIIGYSRDELVGLPFEKVVDKKYLQLAIEGYMRRMKGEAVPEIAEIELIAKTGEQVPVEVSSALINYQGRPSNLVIVRDIRERKRMEEQRLKLEKLATMGELATMVGHDLRNPLQSIENATYYLNNELPRLPIPQKAIEMLQIINNSVNYADKIIRDLHDFSATKKPILQKTNINAIVKETLSQVETPNNVKLVTKLSRLPQIEANKDMIKRVLLNLAVNGIQAMENGGTLKVSTKKTKGFVEVSFKDTGTGISKENMKKIFTPFFTTKAKGMGMGLPICKRFVESHGGSIETKSEEGKGTTFTVKLPIQ